MNLVNLVKSLGLAALLITAPQTVLAQQADTATPAAESVSPPVEPMPSAQNPTSGEAAAVGEAATPSAGDYTYTPMKPTPGKGMPVDAGIDFQDQYSPDGETAYWLSNIVLLPIMVVISLFVLGLLLWAMARYRAKPGRVPSKTTHNSLIEVIWTLVPVLILLAIAVPSIGLLAKQYESAPEDALTIKVTGYQWYWGYSYPDNGGVEIISNMLDKAEADARGEPHQLAVDNRLIVPAGKPIRVLVTAADVIHSFAVPSLWFKIDAVPGRINERKMFIKEPGVYYGQCSELCGARHGYMPIAVEALPEDEWNQWIVSQGGSLGGEEETAAAPAANDDAANDNEGENDAGEDDAAPAEAEAVETAMAPAN